MKFQIITENMFVVSSEPLHINIYEMLIFYIINSYCKGLKIKKTDYFVFRQTNLGFLEKPDLILEYLENFSLLGFLDKTYIR